MIALRFIAIAIGYFIGVFQTGYIYGKCKGIDIREHGSGNAGTTNVIRVLGKKAGAVTFLGDCLKSIIAIILVKFLFVEIFTGDIKVLEMYAGFGAVLGHNYPFYLKFKGGKGIACSAGVTMAVCPLTIPICLLAFILCVAITKYVSLGSIVIAFLFVFQIVIFNELGLLHVASSSILEFNLLALLFSVMAVVRHRTNIVRLLHGTENKVGKKVE